ncbi:hypothetical protein [Lentilactobacillus kisonensis]|uniref:hypothetical protein n=1 Tax=Lentilactobacillus kisonensis TaxID=481722 RepID=UPI000B2135BC|nr:hypothetical protein [Lentilactobacillus kisonensis]
MPRYDDVFNPNGYQSENYRRLNQAYQTKMTDRFNRRQIDYPIKQLQFEAETVKLTSIMSQQQYLKLQSFVEAFPTAQKSGPSPVVGKDAYQSMILYRRYQLFDSTNTLFVAHWGLGTRLVNTSQLPVSQQLASLTTTFRFRSQSIPTDF